MIDEQGNFTEAYNPTEILGEGYEDYKGLADVKSIQQLTKFAADNHRAFGKKMENIIQIPKDDASDEDKAAFNATLREKLGIPAGEGDYKWPQPEEGKEDPYTDETKAFWNHVFKEAGLNQSQADALIAKVAEYNTAAGEKHKSDLEEQIAQQMKEDIEAFDKIYPGDKKPEALRHVLKAIEEFGSDALKAVVKEQGLYDDHNLEKWADYVPLNNLPFLANVGMKAANATMPKGEVSPMNDVQLSQIAALNNKTVEDLKKEIAVYPNSWQSMNKMPA
jgi:hypothetical protein